MPTLDFKGKQHIYAHHLTVPHRPLVLDESRSLNPGSAEDNLIIKSDNLHALKALLPRYAGRIKCIYIDPPYNTGNEEWFYNDNVNSQLLREWFEHQNPVEGEDLERHDKWLCMMWPRLHLLKELLADNGVIFVSIDDNEQHHLRMMMDEVFGEKNFIANIVWHHRKSSQNDIDVSLSHNHIVCYTANKSLFSFNAGNVDETKFLNLDNDSRGPWVVDPMDAPGVRENLTYKIVNPNTGAEFYPPVGRHWRFSKEKYDKALRENRIVFGKTGTARPQYKRFLSEAKKKGKNIFTIWSDVGTAAQGTKELIEIFGRGKTSVTPKPTDLIQKIVKVSTDKDSIILDSFAGSGTTAQAVLSLNREDGGNRKFILVECEDYADSITAERIRQVIKGVPSSKDKFIKQGLGGSFNYCTLGEPIDIESLLTGDALPTYSSLAAYLLYTATGTSAGISKLHRKNKDGLFYSNDDTNFYLLYEPNLNYLRSNNSVLTEDRARQISKASEKNGEKAVVFGAGKFIGQRELSKMGITFSQLPFEIFRAE